MTHLSLGSPLCLPLQALALVWASLVCLSEVFGFSLRKFKVLSSLAGMLGGGKLGVSVYQLLSSKQQISQKLSAEVVSQRWID